MIKLSNITLTVTENFYMTMAITEQINAGEDIIVDFVIPQDLGYRYRFDYSNGCNKNYVYLNGQTTLTIKAPYNSRGLLWMQLFIDTTDQGKRKTNTLFARVFGSVYDGSQTNVIVEELEQLAFVEVQTDPDTMELVFYSLAGNEVGRVNISSAIDLQPIYDLINTITNDIIDINSAIQTINASLTEIDNRVTINTNGITNIEQELNATQENLTENYYDKNEVDNIVSGIETGTEWKHPVATFADLATTYPNPEIGWSALVINEAVPYTWNGTEWVQTFSQIPIVTNNNNGIMTSEMLNLLNTNTSDIITANNAITTLRNNTETALDGKAPMVHSVLANGDPTTYGAGTLTQFGHVKLGNSLVQFDDSTAASIPLVQQTLADSNTYTDNAIRATNKFIERTDDTADWVQIIQELTIYRPVPFSFNAVASETLFGSVLTTDTEGFIVRLGGFSMDLWFTSNGGQYFYTARIINPNVQYLFRYTGESLIS